MANDKKIYVYADWEQLTGAPVLMGQLNVVHTRGREVFSFEYTPEWLAAEYQFPLDPDLQFYSGPQFNTESKANFGIFLDSSPDRWGRTLMKRREAISARLEKRKPVPFFESDFLLGVYDEQRMGGLRFKLTPEGDFLSANKMLAAPPWTSLRELEQASLEVERDEYEDEEALRWINMLIAPGSSLGGARPKAGVMHPDGSLWIAKFPSGSDDHDIGAWEAVALSIAKDAGIQVPDFMPKKYSNKHHTFLSQRFDRTPVGERIHFASAMTLLGHTDGADHIAGISYLDLAAFIIQSSAQPNQDLEELWKRIVLNILIKNTDDHLRNHGFLLTETGWKLSPVYDVNPFPDGTGLTLNISEDDNSLDIELALSIAPFFRIKKKPAEEIITRIRTAAGNWRNIASAIKIPKREQDLMEGAFTMVSS